MDEIPLLAQPDGLDLFFPNTRLIDGQAAYEHADGKWLLAGQCGLLSFDSKTGRSQFHRIEIPSKSNARVTALVEVNGRVWLGTANHGIFEFDTGRMRFSPPFRVPTPPKLGGGSNLDLLTDSKTGDIWASTFGNFSRFNKASSNWESLDHEFRNLGIGEPSSWHDMLDDGDALWVVAGAHHKSIGGLLRFDYASRRWEAFREELFGHHPTRVDGIELISSPSHLWAMTSETNGFNKFISVYDKAAGSWASYPRDRIGPAIDLLIEELPRCSWAKRRPIVASLKSALSSARRLQADHPFCYSPAEIETHENLVSRLEEAFSRVDPDAHSSRGQHSCSNQGNQILKNVPGSVPQTMRTIQLTQVRFRFVLAAHGRRVLVQADDDLSLIDTDRRTMARIEMQRKLREDGYTIQTPAPEGLFQFTISSGGMCMTPGRHENFEVDLNNFAARQLDDSKEPLARGRIPLEVPLDAGKRAIWHWDGIAIARR